MIDVGLIESCAPDVAPETIAAIIRVESGGNPLAIHINGPITPKEKPKSRKEAVAIVKMAMKKGYSADIGLMQVNTQHLTSFGLTPAQLFDPCTNIRAGSKLLVGYYREALKHYENWQDALKAALSAYNTGSFEGGFHNGYVYKFVQPAPNSPETADIKVDLTISYKEDRVMNDVTEIKEDEEFRPDEEFKKKLEDTQVPGREVEFTPEEADWLGAFQEDALTEEEAKEASDDLSEAE